MGLHWNCAVVGYRVQMMFQAVPAELISSVGQAMQNKLALFSCVQGVRAVEIVRHSNSILFKSLVLCDGELTKFIRLDMYIKFGSNSWFGANLDGHVLAKVLGPGFASEQEWCGQADGSMSVLR